MKKLCQLQTVVFQLLVTLESSATMVQGLLHTQQVRGVFIHQNQCWLSLQEGRKELSACELHPPATAQGLGLPSLS